MVDIFNKDGTPVPNPNMANKKSPPYLSYHIDRKLLKFLTKTVIPRINENDKDYVMLIDGYEGSGKSTLGQQVGKFVDPTLCLERVCMTASEFKKAIMEAPKGSCVIYDEAVTGMSAGESITRVGRLLKSLMMQMRQKNLFVIVIIPSIFEFSKYAVLSRARSLFHTYEIGSRMGYWAAYSRADMRKLYLGGKKTHSFKIRSHFTGRFYGKYAINDEDYRKKKEQALMDMDDDDGKIGESKMTFQRKIFLTNLYLALKKFKNWNQKEFCVWLQGIDVEITNVNLCKMLAETRKIGKLLTIDD